MLYVRELSFDRAGKPRSVQAGGLTAEGSLGGMQSHPVLALGLRLLFQHNFQNNRPNAASGIQE